MKNLTLFSLLLFMVACQPKAVEIIVKPDIQPQNYTEKIPGSNVKFDLIAVKSGTFQMGKTAQEAGKTISLSGFWMGKYEVTFDEYNLFQNKEYDSDSTRSEQAYKADAVTRPSPPYMDFTYGMGKIGGFPAVSMTQQAALRYCKWLYDKTGHFYRLPTEAEWEYACRAGTETDFSFGNAELLQNYAWYYDNSFEKFHKVGEKKPNPWGFFDMYGNVAEWTLDFYEKDYFDAIKNSTDPWIKPTKKHSRTVKGGSFDDSPSEMTSAFRLKSSPKWQARDPQIPKSKWWNPDSSFVGFRIVRPFQTYTHDEIVAFFSEAIKD